MPYYLDSLNKLHFLDSEEFESLLPSGCIRITDDEAKIHESENSKPTLGQLAIDAKFKRDKLLREVQDRVDRYRNQLDASISTTDSPETFKAMLIYLQSLRDITKQSGFPDNIEWPIL